MTIELIDTEIEEGEDSGGSVGTGIANSGTVPSSAHSTIPPAVAEVERWSEYVEKYVSSVSPQVSLERFHLFLQILYNSKCIYIIVL